MVFEPLTMLRAIWSASGPGTANERAVLTVLLRHAGDEGTCYPSLPTICAEASLGETAVRAALRRLAESKWIKVVARLGFQTLYTLRTPSRNEPPRETNPLAKRTPLPDEGEPSREASPTPSPDEGEMPKELPIELPITPHSAREEPSDLGEADPAEPPPSTARSVAPTAERPAPLAPADLVALLAELTAEGHAYGTNVGAQLAQGRRLTHGQREALKRIQAQREREAPGVAKAAARSPPRGRSTAQRCPEGEAGEFKGKVY